MKELILARETGENIAELIEEHTQSSHMKSIASDIRTLVAEAGELGYLVVTFKQRVSVECACGCGRLFIPDRKGRMRKYYGDACRQRARRQRMEGSKEWTIREEQAVVQGLRNGMSVLQVANTLGRTERSVAIKKGRLQRKGLIR